MSKPQSYYLLARIFEKERDFEHSARLCKDTIRLGFSGIEPISQLLKISCHLKEKNAIIRYITVKYNEFKKRLIRTKKISLQKDKRVKGLGKIEKRLVALGKRLGEVTKKDKG